jgi:hypothetical protein
MPKEDPHSMLDEAASSRLERMFAGCDEVVGADHVISVLAGDPSHSGDEQLVAYIGIEPSGTAHLGYVILADTIRNMLDEGVNVIILLADWHAWVNDKFNRDMDKIALAGEYMTEVFRARQPGGGRRPRPTSVPQRLRGHGFGKVLGTRASMLKEHEPIEGAQDFQHHGEGRSLV